LFFFASSSSRAWILASAAKRFCQIERCPGAQIVKYRELTVRFRSTGILILSIERPISPPRNFLRVLRDDIDSLAITPQNPTELLNLVVQVIQILLVTDGQGSHVCCSSIRGGGSWGVDGSNAV
jgi:hypothetical protein